MLHRLYYRECIAYLKAHGVSPIVYSNDAHKAGIAEALNQWNVQILQEDENVFCFAAFHPDDPNGLEIAETVLSHPRVVGIKLQHLVQRFSPNDSRLYPLYEMIMEKNKRILFHVGTGSAGNRNVGVDHELNKDRIVYGSDFPNIIFPMEEEIQNLLSE